MKSSGTLYIVATPIGNLQDITLRSIDILTKVEIIACEDTRRTGILLKHIRDKCHPQLILPSPQPSPLEGDEGEGTKLTLLSYYEQNELRRIPQILNALKNGIDVALLSDSGTPTISDPGFKLVRECIKEKIRVESIPGPSSVISSLVVSGLPTDKFLFLGYLPKKSGKRKKLLEELTLILYRIKVTVIIFEAPHRLLETLKYIREVFGNIDIVIARELTKIHEEVRRENIEDAMNHFLKTFPKGEFVILFNLGQT